jgi:integrase
MIRRHFSLNELRETTKSKRIKVLPLDPTVKDALTRLPRHITSPFVFHKRGNAYSESYGRKLWNRTIAALGIKISFYQGTRHSSATEALNRTNLDLVRQFLGHTRPAMTEKYAKQNPEGLKAVLRKDK